MQIKINPQNWFDIVAIALLAPPITVGMLGLAALCSALALIALPFVVIGLIIYSIFY